MLNKTTLLHGFVIHAKDGELGKIDDLYFDDESWAIRYLTVETGSWLSGKSVLISPYSIMEVDWQAKKIHVLLDKKQVENSPSLNVHQTVSRQHEGRFLDYYGYPSYWDGPYLWGPALYPAGYIIPAATGEQKLPEEPWMEPADIHLRSVASVTGYHIAALDGEIGHVAGFFIDSDAWAIRYIEVATNNWWPGKKVLLSPAWVESVSWSESTVHVAVTRKMIQDAPEYKSEMPITRDYENQLYGHYGRPSYWLTQAGHASAFASGDW